MANALGITATDITYKKYYAEFCAMHDTEFQAGDKNQMEQVDEQIERIITNHESSEFNDVHHANKGSLNQHTISY